MNEILTEVHYRGHESHKQGTELYISHHKSPQSLPFIRQFTERKRKADSLSAMKCMIMASSFLQLLNKKNSDKMLKYSNMLDIFWVEE